MTLIADWLGIQPWYLISGSVCALMGVVGFLSPALLNIEKSNGNGKKEAADIPEEAAFEVT